MRVRSRRLWTLRAVPALLLFLAACGQTPETTEKARGVLTGREPSSSRCRSCSWSSPVGLVVAAVVARPVVRSAEAARRSAAPDVEERGRADEVVAGITVGRAGRAALAVRRLRPHPGLRAGLRPQQRRRGPGRAAAERRRRRPSGPVHRVRDRRAAGSSSTRTSCSVPAGEEITVTFNNEDTGVPHDFTVWEDRRPRTPAVTAIATTRNGERRRDRDGDVQRRTT